MDDTEFELPRRNPIAKFDFNSDGYIAPRTESIFTALTKNIDPKLEPIFRQDRNWNNEQLLRCCQMGAVWHWVLDLLDNNNCDLGMRDANGNTALHLAIGRNAPMAVLERFLSAPFCSDLNTKNSGGFTYLMMSCVRPKVDLLRVLLANKQVEVNATDSHGNTALHHALTCRRRDVVSLLMRSNANASLKNAQGQSAIDLAEQIKDEVMLCLVKRRFTWGIALDFLIDIDVPDHYTTADVCEKIIIPYTKKEGVSLAEKLVMQNDQMNISGVADVFISHAWSYNWKQMLSAIHHGATAGDAVQSRFDPVFVGDAAALMKRRFVWLDVATLNQNIQTQVISPEALQETFSTNLATIGKAELVIMNWKRPESIKRAWCCFEYLTIMESNIPFKVKLHPNDLTNLKQTMESNHNGQGLDWSSVLANVDVRACQAREKADLDAILALMQRAGFERVNEVVLQPLKMFLAETIESYVREEESILNMRSHEKATVLRNAINLFAVLKDHAKVDRYQKLLREEQDRIARNTLQLIGVDPDSEEGARALSEAISRMNLG